MGKKGRTAKTGNLKKRHLTDSTVASYKPKPTPEEAEELARTAALQQVYRYDIRYLGQAAEESLTPIEEAFRQKYITETGELLSKQEIQDILQYVSAEQQASKSPVTPPST